MSAPPPVVALLGPTNTGKTHLALERLLQHPSGMIGFPLRLLARENYDRLVALRGASAVALVTGEERILPPAPSYYVCTVEAMPLDRRVAFLAVDEIQLCADRERGHVFTDRLLHARGLQETLFLGAATIQPLLRRLLPQTAFISRPRLSTLSYSGPKKIGRLPKRCAVVVFSVAEVYEVAERIRHQSGGAALVFGALSPRTRNAQVGLYQAGEVDYLVATDAIGMGLNLDIDHVVFTGLTKFDGLGPRPLQPAEVAQIAGRAGRYLKDGTFSPTVELGDFDPRLVEAIEHHRFDPLTALYWRNPDLRFDSVAALLESLEARSPLPTLVRVRQADDHRALAALAQDSEVLALARHPEHVRLLWDVAQIPDFRNVLTDAHTRLLVQVFRRLRGPEGRLAEDWVAAQVEALDRPEGDLDTLLARIAGIRTWTYVSHRTGWLADPAHWREHTRAVEDRLSDTLHQRLTEQFVDRRAAVLARHQPDDLIAEVTDEGEVLIQGLLAGRLAGFRFEADPGVRSGSRGLLAAANRALRADVPDRVRRFTEEPDQAFALSLAGQLAWRGAPVARLSPGESPLAPRIEPLPSDLLDPPHRERVRRRLAAWLEAHLRQALAPLFQAREADLSGAARGLVFALGEGLGAVARRAVARQLAAVTREDRQALGRLGISLGRVSIFLPALLRPEALRLRRLLWTARHGRTLSPLLDGRPSVPLESGMSSADLLAGGYAPAGPRALRVDRLERLSSAAYRLAGERSASALPELSAIAGSIRQDTLAVLEALDYQTAPDGSFRLRPSLRRQSRSR